MNNPINIMEDTMAMGHYSHGNPHHPHHPHNHHHCQSQCQPVCPTPCPPSPCPPPPCPPPPCPPEPFAYVVRKGDSVYFIAQRFGTTMQAIIFANNLTNPDLIYPGQILYIPGV